MTVRPWEEITAELDIKLESPDIALGVLGELLEGMFPNGVPDLKRMTWPEPSDLMRGHDHSASSETSAEARLRTVEMRFRTLIEQIPAVTFLAVLGEGHNEIYVSPHIEVLLGYTQVEWLSDPFLWYWRLHPDDRALWNEEFARGCRTGGPFRADCRFMDRNDRPVWVHGEARIVRDELGRPMFLQGVAFDISEMKRTEELTQRHQAAEKFQLAVEASPTGMVMSDRDGKILLVNTQIEKLFGYTRAELIGQPIDLLVPERFRAEHPAHRRAFFETPRPRSMGEGRELFGLRKDNSEFAVEIALTPIDTMDGKVVMASIIDITKRKQMEDELRRSNAALEQFAYVASHDLQEPLRMVASYTELLGESYQGKLDGNADMYIHYAVDGAKRMQSLITDLLSYSRVGSQGKPLVATATGEVLAGVLHVLDAAIHAANAQVELGALPVVLADEGQLRQLFQNLVGNAIKFRGDAPPRVRVDARRDGGMWLFSVADNGVGIDMQYADRIFQMFQRLHQRDKYEGSGIGLAIAKCIVERHGGRIWLESQAGAGTTFFFTLMPALQAK